MKAIVDTCETARSSQSFVEQRTPLYPSLLARHQAIVAWSVSLALQTSALLKHSAERDMSRLLRSFETTYAVFVVLHLVALSPPT